MSLEGLVFSVVGRFSPHTQAEVSALLRERGAEVHNALQQSTQYLISGQHLGYVDERARIIGARILDESLYQGLIDGTLSREQFDAKIAALEAKEHVEPTMEASAFIEALRPKVQGDEIASRVEVVEMLDQATPEAQQIACHYLGGTAWGERHLTLPKSYNFLMASGGKFYGIPKHWKVDILAGVDSPKYNIIRVGGFSSDNLGNTVLMNIFKCTSLNRVELLDLERNKVGVGFMKALANSVQFDGVKFLSLSSCAISKGMMKPLLGRQGLSSLRYLNIDGTVKEDALDLVCSNILEMGVSVISLPRHMKMNQDRLEAMLSDDALDMLSLIDTGLFTRFDESVLFERIEEVGVSDESPVVINMSACEDHKGIQERYQERFTGRERIRLSFDVHFGWDDCIAIAQGQPADEVMQRKE